MRSALLAAAFVAASAASAAAAFAPVNATAYALRGPTASGTRAGPGQIALSRDLIRRVPYGSVVRLTAVGGPRCGGYSTAPLRVTDTMPARTTNAADVWLPTAHAARAWGRCVATLTVLSRPRGGAR